MRAFGDESILLIVHAVVAKERYVELRSAAAMEASPVLNGIEADTLASEDDIDSIGTLLAEPGNLAVYLKSFERCLRAT